jgi:hypothetical protein
MRSAKVASIYENVPLKYDGVTERGVSYLTENSEAA